MISIFMFGDFFVKSKLFDNKSELRVLFLKAISNLANFWNKNRHFPS